MPNIAKVVLGLCAAWVAGWVVHGPLGHGERFVGRLQTQAQSVVADAAIPGVAVRMERAPLRRVAVLSGPADEFQREGQGQFPGLNDRIRAIPGMAGVRWAEGS